MSGTRVCTAHGAAVPATYIEQPGFPTVMDGPQWGVGRVIRVVIDGKPEQVATVTAASSDGCCRLYLPDSNEYVEVEWRM